MQTTTKSIDVEDDLLTSLAEIYEVDPVQKAIELALWRLANILEIEALNRDNRDAYWPGFDPAEYLKTGDCALDETDEDS